MLGYYASEFDAVAEGTRTQFLADAAGLLSSTVWGSRYQLGTVRLAAHWLEQRARALAALAASGSSGSVVGAVRRQKAGDLEVEYATSVSSSSSSMGGGLDDEALKTTSHGIEFLALRAGLVKAAAYVVV